MNHRLSSHPYASFVHRVDKPARYLGGEYNSVVKPWDEVSTTFCLAFPDLYDIGMSHMGTKILYSIVNKADDLLMERCFTPWPDMEAQLRERELPLVSLESARPLRDFDVVGFSLQYEMTYTNVFTMLDLGGIPLRNSDRTLDDPLVIAGGPSATHPEPMAPFVDVFLIGDAEERLPRLLRHWAELRAAGGRTREEMLVELSREGGVYCPDLYERTPDPETGMLVVTGVRYPGVPERVERAFLDDISRYRFPDDSPVAVAEAIFDRMSVEIARGCTEGCRFCQAGMIYRPVRERDPEEIIDTVLGALDRGGYDEAAITSLSTADYSCISPLIKSLMERLRERKVSLGISSLRAYGLSDDLLDEIASVKATGLTFAPEAGTQRMRDVINKNITEDDIYATCHRVFSKGWQRMKLYFILGLPTEQDEDIVGIAEMGRQALEIGGSYQRNVKVTVSVSSHVPKPHTPFQWAAMDTLEDIERKQRMLLALSKQHRFAFRRHDMKVSHLECITGRGDIRVGEILLEAWERGARFDGWDERLNWDAWQDSIASWEVRHGVDRELFFGTLPVDAALPWDHIDVGLEDGFLLKEYRKALADRLSPPCGKPRGAKVHHTNLADAEADERKLVCYHCGIACDMTKMADDRHAFLRALGAEEPPQPLEINAREAAHERVRRGLAPHDFGQGEPVKYRIRYTKLGPVVLQGHLDLVRIFPRVVRRAGLTSWYSQGFSPKPGMSFGPALALGARSLAEYVDLSLTDVLPAAEIHDALRRFAPDGLHITGVRRIMPGEPGVSKAIDIAEFHVATTPEALGATDVAEALERLRAAIDMLREDPDREITVLRKQKQRTQRVWDVVAELQACPTDELAEAADLPAGRVGVTMSLRHGDGASLKPHEVLELVAGCSIDDLDIARLGCWHLGDDTVRIDPLVHGEPEDVSEGSIGDARAARRGNVRGGGLSAIPTTVPRLSELAAQ